MLIRTMSLENITQMETEASKCELNHLFMKDSIHCSQGNECEPLDINFSSDLVISHSVIVSSLPEPAKETVLGWHGCTNWHSYD